MFLTQVYTHRHKFKFTVTIIGKSYNQMIDYYSLQLYFFSGSTEKKNKILSKQKKQMHFQELPSRLSLYIHPCNNILIIRSWKKIVTMTKLRDTWLGGG